MSGRTTTVPVLLMVALLPGCGGLPDRAKGTWVENEKGLRINLLYDGTGDCEISDESEVLFSRFTVSWRKSAGRVRVEMYCRQVYVPGQECGDPGYEDFELDCELVKETVKTDEREGDRLVCSGPDGTYTFEQLL